MNAADTLDLSGSAPATTSISLWDNVGGWNLVGYPSMAERVLPGALSEHGVGGSFSLIYAYYANDPFGDPWKLFDPLGAPYSNDLQPMTPGWGYWIDVTTDRTWNLNFLADPVGP